MAQGKGFLQKSWHSFLAMLASFMQFCIDKESFCSNVCHRWSITIKALIGSGHSFFVRLGVVHRRYIYVYWNLSCFQRCWFYSVSTEHIHVCFQYLRTET